MKSYIVDFETTYGKDFSVKNIPIAEYCRHPRFEIIGCGVVDLGTDEAFWLDGEDECRDGLAEIAPGNRFVAHHAQFDGWICQQNLGVHPHKWACTLGMARAIYPRLPRHSLEALTAMLNLGAPKSVPYALMANKSLAELRASGVAAQVAEGGVHDAQLEAALWRLLYPCMPDKEMELLDQELRQYFEPVLCGDLDVLADCVVQGGIARDRAIEATGYHITALRSAAKFVPALQAALPEGERVPMKPSPTYGRAKMVPALGAQDEGFIALRHHESEEVRRLVRGRLAAMSNIGVSRAERLLVLAEQGPLPVYSGYCAAHTFRSQGGDKTNLKNLPRASGIRGGIVSAPGHKLVKGDLAQIEARGVAVLAGQWDLVDWFASGVDVYCAYAEAELGEKIDKEDPRRHTYKQRILSCGYGMGAKEYARRARLAGRVIEYREALDEVMAYRMRFAKIPELWRRGDIVLEGLAARNEDMVRRVLPECLDVDINEQTIILPSGLRLDYGGIRWSSAPVSKEDIALAELGEFKPRQRLVLGSKKIWGGVFTENINQALMRIPMTDAKLDLAKRWTVALDVYDEIVLHVPEHLAEIAAEDLKRTMTKTIPWMPELPLSVDVAIKDRYGAVVEYNPYEDEEE